MPFINLIQEQRLEARRNENRARLFFFSFVGSAVVSVFAVGLLMFENEMMSSQESNYQAKAQKLAPLVKRIQANQDDYAELQPRLETLQGAQLVTGRWSRILDHLTRQTPNQTWLTSVRCTASEADKPVSVSFVGMSTHQELIGDFIERLQSCPDLTDVALKYTMEKQISQTRDIEFEISADITGTATAKPKDEVKKEAGS
jgi:Tfp pilus assembly protein PilN